MTNEKLLKNKLTYLKLILFTGVTGAYNFYLDKNKRAIKMLVVFAVSLMLTFVYYVGLIGIILNMFLWLKDLIKLKKDVDEYNENIKKLLSSNNGCNEVFELKKKSIKEYKLSILTFGLLGLEDLYLENYSLRSPRFIINGLYIFIFSMMIIVLGIGAIYITLKYPESSRQGAMWFVVFLIWGLMIPFLPIIMISPYLVPIMVIITLYKIISKLSDMEHLVLVSNDSLEKSIKECSNTI